MGYEGINPVLVIGNRTYSSWSLRGWLAMAMTGKPFDEVMVWLDEPDHRERMRLETGGFGTVPTVRLGDVVIGDSLAIAEFAAEWAPDKRLWPDDPVERALARMACARMHSGFMALRASCPMNLSNRFDDFQPSDDVRADLDVLEDLWETALQRSGGPFLFGGFSLADAFYAPVVTRIDTFRLPVSESALRYCAAVLRHPLMRQWIAAAAQELSVVRPRTDRLSAGGFTPGDWPLLKDLAA